MDVNTAPGNAVAREDTVPPKVEFRNRTVTDKWWGVIYILSYVAFLSTGFLLVSKSHMRYEREANGGIQISEYFLGDANECCSSSDNVNNDWGVCGIVNPNKDGGRRLQSGNSTLTGDEGIFDVFLLKPEIIVGLTSLALAIAFAWVVALRFFAKPIVILVELCKIAIVITVAVFQENTVSKVFVSVIAAAMVGYAIWARKKIIFAAKIITHSTIAMKENPSIFIGGLISKLLFAGNAALFVYFFAESFNVVELKGIYDERNAGVTCEFVTPAYVSGMSVYLGLSYLWTVLVFDKMRLSMIATVVGSWHFHPQDKPSIWLAMKNIGPSFGTLGVSALISSIAEYVCGMSGRSAWTSWVSPFVCITGPLHILMCCVGACLKTVIQMLTKFAVILHVFTGQPFLGSANSVFKILSRHFKGGFVTEVTSRSVLGLASYAFSVGIAMVAWKWVDAEFDCGNFVGSGNKLWLVVSFLVVLFNCWYPVLGIYIMIFVNKILQNFDRNSLEAGNESINYIWIPPLTATFVGCIAMMMFQFLSSIFLDTIDTLFLCFAIDMDNNVDLSNDEFTSLVKEMPDYYTDTESANSLTFREDPEAPVPIAMAVPIQEKG